MIRDTTVVATIGAFATLAGLVLLTPDICAQSAAHAIASRVEDSAIGRERIDSVTAATREYRKSGIARAVTEGSAVSYPFGHSQPTVTCVVLRVCVIELQAGEQVVSRPMAGDTVRWIIARSAAGPGGSTTLVAVKPTDCDLTTNLVLPTDRRIYDLTLDSPPCKEAATNPRQAYTRHVKFYYPDEEPDQWTKKPEPPAAPAVVIRPDVESLNFDYRVKKDKHFPWAPAQVFDDGVHVYIKLPEEARHAEAPVLFVLEDDGSRTLLNYAVSNYMYITDRIFKRAVLVTGVDGTERRVTIENRGPNAPGGS